MQNTRNFLAQVGLPPGDAFDLPASPRRFPDGAQYRVEIPSVEGPRALAAVLEEAERHAVLVHRVSQGSGIMLLTDDEIGEMARLGREAQIEVSLFVGPRAAWDTGAQITASAGKNLGARLRGMEQVVFAVEDVRRACALGIRSVLVADEGLLWLANEMKKAGELPANLVLKVSVQMGAANPISVRWMEQLGAGTYNVPTDLSLPQLAAIRQAVALPLDIYVEAPDDFGGFVRHYEVPEMVRVAAPMYVKLGLRNAPNIYPSGAHMEAAAVALARERVHRAAIALDMLRRYYPEAKTSLRGAGDLGIPMG
ncbi:MAG: U32 family peptidase [Chloroflexi bacterium]|nr:U32 family peptidase [Chloroflexota bacterium]MCI0578211.1 U32 family peptidase [Chloroflexota bacterium]MCI0645296.1 U32 family peptidase [Chloroflexota bacterium]MCI0729550.1 U32 family peptidase [Chloroflexota bacterium]